MRPLYILTYLHPRNTIYYLYFLYNLPNSTTSTSTTRLTVYIKNIIGTKTKNKKDYTAENHNTKDIIKVTVETGPEINTTFVTRKDISL
jgi:hypothetical protein